MKALILKEDKTLLLGDIESPAPLEGEVLVKLHASALNHRELWIQKGLYPGMQLPCILGADGSGTVVELGKGVESSLLHQECILYPAYDWGEAEHRPTRSFRVLGMPDPGTIADYICVPKTMIHPKPAFLSFTEAAALPVAGLTAWRALTRHGRITATDKVLITGIGGGVAQMALTLAKAYGAEVFVTSSNQSKIQQAIASGATGGVNYKEENWPRQLKALSGGLDIVVDSSPSAELANYLAFMNYGGRIVYYGSTGSPKTTIPLSKFFLRHIQCIGTAMGSPREFDQLLEFMTQKQIRPVIDKVFDLSESIEAMHYLSQGNQIGKVVIKH